MSVHLPKELLSSLEGLPGYDAEAFIRVHEEGRQVTSLRMNPGRMEAARADDAKAVAGEAAGDDAKARAVAAEDGILARAAALFPRSARVPWSSYGLYLPERPSFTLDPLFHGGAYYVQEASSMFLEEALRQTVDVEQRLRVLDLCAAPGGKSTLLQSVIRPDSLLVSNEVIKSRVTVLEENLIKWGGVNTVVTNNDARDFQRLEDFFDVIVVDAPCSGSGLFRRDPDAIEEWSPANVALCQQRQQRILADVWPALRQDGVLIYSTCSYSREEDEDILDWIQSDLEAEGLRLTLSPSWNVVETTGKNGGCGYRFYPDKLGGEGFFISCLRKRSGSTFVAPRKKGNLERLPKKEETRIDPWIKKDLGLSFFLHQEQVRALPETLMADLPVLQGACYLKRAGVLLGRLSPKEFIPEHELALSVAIHSGLPAVELSKEMALTYLRKEEVYPDTVHRGWVLAKYAGVNLGWMKVMPNRSNNYYPKEWRILKREG